MNPVAITGSDEKLMGLFIDLLHSREVTPWLLWDATNAPVPYTLTETGNDRIVTFTARMYVAECKILATRRILDRTNRDHVWILETDDFVAADIPTIVAADAEDGDVLLGRGCARFSRKALEHMAKDFGFGVDYSELLVKNISVDTI